MAYFLNIAHLILTLWFKAGHKLLFTISMTIIGQLLLIYVDEKLGSLFLLLAISVVFLLYDEDKELRKSKFYAIHRINYLDVFLLKNIFSGAIVFLIILTFICSSRQIGNSALVTINSLNIIFHVIVFISLARVINSYFLRFMVSFILLIVTIIISLLFFDKLLIQFLSAILVSLTYLTFRVYGKNN